MAALGDAQQLTTATVPLVRQDGAGGHAPVVAIDKTPTSSFTSAEQNIIDLLTLQVELLTDIRVEMLATRLAIQERLNEGNATQHDFREQAQAILDRSETEEP